MRPITSALHTILESVLISKYIISNTRLHKQIYIITSKGPRHTPLSVYLNTFFTRARFSASLKDRDPLTCICALQCHF